MQTRNGTQRLPKMDRLKTYPRRSLRVSEQREDLNDIPSMKGKLTALTYSQTAAGNYIQPDWHGPIPFEDYLREKLVGQSRARLAPQSIIDNAIRIHLADFPKSEHLQYMTEVKKFFDSELQEDKLVFYNSTKANYINVGFPNAKDCIKALRKQIFYNEKPIPTEAIRYAKKDINHLLWTSHQHSA